MFKKCSTVNITIIKFKAQLVKKIYYQAKNIYYIYIY